MKRLLILEIVLALAGVHGRAQTIYGGANSPVEINGGYVSDYQPSTTVLADGSVTITNGGTYEHGNTLFQNDGSWNSNAGGIDLFVASGTGTISGSVAPNFFHARFNTGASSVMNIVNTQGVNVAGELQFNNGITTTVRNAHANGALRFADGAGYTGGNTDAQHVNGYVTKTGDDAFVFPVGSGTDLRTLSISAPAGGATISTAWFVGNPATVTDPSDGVTHDTTFSGKLSSIIPIGFWDWTNTSGSDDRVQVIASIPDVSSFIEKVADLCLAGWDGKSWIMIGPKSTATGLTENSTITGTIPDSVNITALAIGISSELPVTLVSFTGKAIEHTSTLAWATTEEINASHFEIERSGDARIFETIGKVDAKGESKALVTYDFTDNNPFPGTNYYRLKQVDFDGSYAYSRTISIHFDDSERISVYPNPVADLLRVESDVPVTSLEISDVKGMKIEGAIVPPSGPSAGMSSTNIRQIDLRGKPSGIYVVKINGRSFKVLKN